jgi:hypothetical protein
MNRLACILLVLVPVSTLAQDVKAKHNQGNRLAYLDEINPYYPHRDFPRLITPQWVGEEGVDAVVVLAIDDMKDPRKYETFLRPILDRLKKIDGRAPVSIMTCTVDPKEPQLQSWLKEGLSIECHTYDHPCPFFKNGMFKATFESYAKCLHLMNDIPNNQPVAFRMPCCDSMNTPSPKFYTEIFTPALINEANQKRNLLHIDSSVFNIFTSADPDLPRSLVLNEKGQERFKRYVPADRSFVNTIENYPYPYLIGNRCWQFPCMTPSDWQAQHLHKPNNPATVEDWKAALDCTVVKKGVFCLVFHPHGWIKNEQVAELVDYADQKHGKKVKFLTFKEAYDRLQKNLHKVGFHFLDIDNDGYLDSINSGSRGEANLWSPEKRTWTKLDFPSVRLGGIGERFGAFGILQKNGFPSYVIREFDPPMGLLQHTWLYQDGQYRKQTSGPANLQDTYTRFVLRDLDGDGVCEMIGLSGMVFAFHLEKGWQPLPFRAPHREKIILGADPLGLRFLDLDGDGKLDLLFSNEQDYGLYLFENMEKGWSKKILAGKAGDQDALPMIARQGHNNGFWVHSGHLWWSNEETVKLRDHVNRRSIKELLGR